MSPQTPAPLTDTEPVAVYQAIAIVVAAAATAFNVVVDPAVVVQAIVGVAALVTAVSTALKARSKVTPVAKP